MSFDEYRANEWNKVPRVDFKELTFKNSKKGK